MIKVTVPGWKMFVNPFLILICLEALKWSHETVRGRGLPSPLHKGNEVIVTVDGYINLIIPPAGI